MSGKSSTDARQRSLPCELAHRLHNVDVMVTPHGFQSMLLLFLPRPALLFEVFPYRYYKRGYGPLSDEFGVRHHGVMSPASALDAPTGSYHNGPLRVVCSANNAATSLAMTMCY